MRTFLTLLLVSVSFIRTWAQDGAVQVIIDTLDNRSLYSIKGDTLTRFLEGKSSSPDQCSSFSITREQYTRKGSEFRQLQTRKIIIGSTCSNLFNSDNVYCLRLVDFKFNNGMVSISVLDSNDKKLKARLKGDSNFEIRLKDTLDKFISTVECNGVRIE